MHNILLFSDLHITQSSLKECILILEEIGMLANKYNVDTVINLGDTFDNLKPTPQELDIFATFIKRLNKKLIIVAADSHESETHSISVINHFGILNEMVTVVKEFKDNNHLYCGHFSLKESLSNYDAKFSKDSFKDYAYVFLGHIHSYQLIKPNICHLGSSRYVDFAEAQDKAKIICLITNYNGEKEQTHFLKLISPISMIELKLGKNTPNLVQNSPFPGPEGQQGKATGKPKSLISEGENPPNPSQIDLLCQKLDKLDPNTKVKIKILDFESYREFLPLVNKYSAKFEVFKYVTDFEVISEKIPDNAKKQMTNFRESFMNYLRNQKIDESIRKILEKEIE